MKIIVLVDALLLLAIGGRSDADVLAQYDFSSLRTSPDTDLNSTATDFIDGPGLTGTIYAIKPFTVTSSRKLEEPTTPFTEAPD